MPEATVVFGIAVTIAGVMIVLLRHREGTSWQPDLTRAQWWAGVAGALVGALGQAGGAVLARAALRVGSDLPDGVVPLQATLVRMVAAVFGLQLVLLVHRRPGAVRRLRRPQGSRYSPARFAVWPDPGRVLVDDGAAIRGAPWARRSADGDDADLHDPGRGRSTGRASVGSAVSAP
ncbi:MAG: hypothetical protein ABIP94_16580 [Planctomycetota bacterium]